MPSFKASVGDRQNVSLDDVCYLLSITSATDEIGQAILSEMPFMVFCSRLSITRTEFNAAGQLGHKPDMMLIVDSDAYDQETLLKYYNIKYTIYKTYMRLDGFTELYCEVKSGD